MKPPSQIQSITLQEGFKAAGYPPLGFWPFCEHELGNGDTFGLYWPIGREDREPIVADTSHDSWQILPLFSSLHTFWQLAERSLDDLRTPLLADDPRSPHCLYEQARRILTENDPASAVASLEAAIKVLPEYTAALCLLSAQYRRLQRMDLAFEIAFRAIIAPPSFGEVPVTTLQWLARQNECPEPFRHDPIWSNRHKLKFRLGGEKTNDDYLILRDAIDAYVSQGQAARAVTLMQTYAELMSGETVSFRERYDFDANKFLERQLQVSEEMGRSRRLALDG